MGLRWHRGEVARLILIECRTLAPAAGSLALIAHVNFNSSGQLGQPPSVHRLENIGLAGTLKLFVNHFHGGLVPDSADSSDRPNSDQKATVGPPSTSGPVDKSGRLIEATSQLIMHFLA